MGRFVFVAAVALLTLSLVACGAAARATWTVAVPAPGVVDITAPRADGQQVVTASGELSLLGGTTLTPFARGPGGYSTGTGEPYLALSNGRILRRAHCAFARGDVFALEPGDQPSVIRITEAGQAQPFAALPAGSFASGIAFDTTGDFGFRLLVTALVGSAADLVAIDCRGRMQTLGETRSIHVEGGMAVAPRSFGRFGGQLIAPDELGGNIIAFDRHGHAKSIAASGLPTGPDIGVESVGFIPANAKAGATALLADRGGQAEPHPGSDALLGVKLGALLRAGARRGDLLAATEGGALTIAVRCDRRCHVRRVAEGPSVAHAEGHIVFTP
jgi:hypothetical protein